MFESFIQADMTCLGQGTLILSNSSFSCISAGSFDDLGHIRSFELAFVTKQLVP